MYNPDLPSSTNQPIRVSASTENLQEIVKFPVVRRFNELVFVQEPSSGQMYIVDETLYKNSQSFIIRSNNNEPIISSFPQETSQNGVFGTSSTNGVGSSNGTIELSGTGTNGTTGLLKGNPDLYDACRNYTLFIDLTSFYVRKGNKHTDPILNKTLDGLYPDAQNQCELWVDLYRCCVDSNGQPTGREKVGEILVARTKQLSSWELCDLPDIDENGKQKVDANGNPLVIKGAGKKLVVKQYVDFNEILDGFPFLEGYNVRWTGQIAMLQRDFERALWGIECPTTTGTSFFQYIDSVKEFLKNNDIISKALAKSSGGKQNYAVTNTKITSARIENGEKITASEGSATYDLIFLCLFEGDCQKEKEPPGPPEFFCVEIDTEEKVNIIDNGGKKKNADGTFTKYTDDELTVILGGKVIRDLLGPRNGTIVTDSNETIFTSSKKKYTLQLTGAITDEQYNADQQLKSVLSNKKINDDYVKIRWTRPNETPERYVYFLVFDTLEELLKYYQQEQKSKKTREKPGSRKTDQPVNGFPCELQETADYQDLWEIFYTRYKICYRSDGSILVELITDGNGNPIQFKSYEEWRDDLSRVNQPVDGTRRYNPKSNCCETANFILPGGMPPPGVSRLEYDLNSAEWVSSNPDDPCDCIQYKIADVYCYYNDQKISLAYPKSLKNDITWVRDGLTGKVETRRKPTADCKEDTEWKIYHPFDLKKDFIRGKRKHITRGLFNLREHMDCYYTSSLQTIESKKYYYDVIDCNDCDKGPYFSIAYGHISGSGSSHIDEYSLDKTPSDAIYGQYQSLCLELPNVKTGRVLPNFKFVSGSKWTDAPHIYVINFYRDGISDKLDPGNFQINLSELSGSFYANNVHTGSNVKVASPKIMSLIDDSNQFDEGIVCDGGELIAYNIVSGTLTGGIYEPSSSNTYGKVFPQLGVIVLDAKRFDEILGFNSVTGSDINGDNSFKLFTSISGAATPIQNRDTIHHLTARSIKYRSTNHYFVRAYPHYTNWSNNPTFVRSYTFQDDPVLGKIIGNHVKYDCFIEDPQVYITSVGLYNDSNELLAIAKLSRPVKKNFDNELLIKIRLHW